MNNLKELLQKEEIIVAPGVYNPITALIAKKVGFKCVYLSGAAFSASLGMPDLGLFTLTELTNTVKYIHMATNMPIIVDVDVGFGGTLNVMRTVIELESVGASAIQIEDQELPKKCGHLSDKKLVSPEDMVHKIKMAKNFAKNLLIIARTDARGVTGLDDAIKRANLYVSAGADIIFPEALISEEEFSEFAKNVNTPLLANMTEFGKTPYISVNRFKELGYKIVIFPVSALRVANKATEEIFKFIMEKGTQKNLLDKMQTRIELQELINYDYYEKLDKMIAQQNVREND